jgi:O-antigen/teichoic acid export membrane protein
MPMTFSRRHRKELPTPTDGDTATMAQSSEASDQAAGEAAVPPAGSFRNRILQAAGWSMSGYVLSQVLRIGSNLILTRLLVPEMFGVMAVATMVHIAVTMISDLGLRPAAIQSSMGDSQTFLDTAWTLQLIHGCLMWLACIVIAVGIYGAANAGWFPADSVYATPGLVWIIVATSFVQVIYGLQSTKIITAYRRLELGRVTQLEILTQVVNVTVAVVLAWFTRSIWSFVVAVLVSAVCSSVASHLYLKGVQNSFRWDRASLRDLIRFGRWIMLSSMFTVLAANGDRLLLAGWITAGALGIYVLAYSLISMLDGVGNRLFMSVAMPALSKVFRETPERLKTTFYKFKLPLDLIYVGAAGAVYGGGRLIIETLYDDRYVGATHSIEVLSFSLLIARYSVASCVYLATGEPRYQTLLNLIKTVSIFTLVPLGYYLFGFEGALWAVSLHALPIVPIIFFLNARLRLNSPLYEMLILLAWPVGYGAATLVTHIVHILTNLH